MALLRGFSLNLGGAIMRIIIVLITMFFLSSLNVSAEGLTSGNLNGKREAAKEPLVEAIQKARFGDSKKVRDGKHSGKKAKRN